MIVYDRLWKKLKERGITQYQLVNQYHFSKGLLDRLRKNSVVTTYTLSRLCDILDCPLEEIAEFVPDKTSFLSKDDDIPGGRMKGKN